MFTETTENQSTIEKIRDLIHNAEEGQTARYELFGVVYHLGYNHMSYTIKNQNDELIFQCSNRARMINYLMTAIRK